MLLEKHQITYALSTTRNEVNKIWTLSGKLFSPTLISTPRWYVTSVTVSVKDSSDCCALESTGLHTRWAAMEAWKLKHAIFNHQKFSGAKQDIYCFQRERQTREGENKSASMWHIDRKAHGVCALIQKIRARSTCTIGRARVTTLRKWFLIKQNISLQKEKEMFRFYEVWELSCPHRNRLLRTNPGQWKVICRQQLKVHLEEEQQ